MSYCPACTQEIVRAEAKFCDECGANLALAHEHAGAADGSLLAPQPDFMMQGGGNTTPLRFPSPASAPPAEAAGPGPKNSTPMSDGVEAPKSTLGRGRFVAATLVVVAAVSTATQYLTAGAFGLPVDFAAGDRVWSTGGLLAVIASIYMGVKCDNWVDFRRRIGVWAGLTAALAFGAVALIAGFSNAYSFTVVDQEERAETFHRELTGRYDVEEESRRICGGDEDYLSCINQHVVLYNVVCRGKTLTSDGSAVCKELKGFIAETRGKYRTCGSGCETRADSDGLWGWPYLRSVPVTVLVSNGDSLPEVAHRERCNFDLGPFKIGNCSRSR